MKDMSGYSKNLKYFLILILMTAFVAGCGNWDGDSGGSSPAGGGVTLTSIAVTPSDALVIAGLSRQLTATGTYSDNSTADRQDRPSTKPHRKTFTLKPQKPT